MRYKYVALCILILFVVGCTSEEIALEPSQPVQPPPSQPEAPATEPPEETQPEETIEDPVEEPEEEIHYDDEEDIGAELGDDGAEEIVPEVEQPLLSEEEEIQKILGLAEKKIHSYYYKYKTPLGKMYNIYVKDNKIRIGSLSDDNKIYIDTEKQTAEEWCISHSRCGRETGKIGDLDYNEAYLDTPIDWLARITDSSKIDEGFYYGKQSWKLDTNIGEVVIDSNFGFIYSIKSGEKDYTFSDASFNTVKDDDVNVPEYLIED